MSTVQHRIDELRRQINLHNYKYYVEAKPRSPTASSIGSSTN